MLYAAIGPFCFSLERVQRWMDDWPEFCRLVGAPCITSLNGQDKKSMLLIYAIRKTAIILYYPSTEDNPSGDQLKRSRSLVPHNR